MLRLSGYLKIINGNDSSMGRVRMVKWVTSSNRNGRLLVLSGCMKIIYLSSRAAIVDFSLPELPTMATVLPAGIFKLKLFKTTCNQRHIFVQIAIF